MSLAKLLKARKEGSLDVYSGLMSIDERLVAKGFPAISPWWKEHIKSLYEGKKLRLVVRCGRRGGKSTTLCRVAVAEVLYGKHKVPPGDIGVFVFISVRKQEAQERLRTIKEILTVLGVPHDARGMEIQLRNKPFIFRVYPANFRSAVGMTCVGWVGDEMSRWRDESDSSNPATDVIASIRPAMATMPNAHEFYISSPWAKLDAHYTYVEKGITEEQHVAIGSTWDANPTLSIARCKTLEPDEPTFQREYCAIPMDNDSRQFFDEAALKQAVSKTLFLPRQVQVGESVVAGGDFAFVADHSAIAVCHIVDKRYILADRDILKPRPGSPLVPSHVCARFATVLGRHGSRAIMADGHYKEAISEHLAKKKIAFMKGPTRPAASYIRARALFNQGLVTIPDDERLIKSMMEISARPTPSGNLSIILPKKEGGGHADFVSAFILALFQRKGRVCTNPYNDGRPKGWTQAEIDEVKAIEKEMKKNKLGIDNYITRL